MAIYRVQGPDGKVHRFEGPDGASPQDVEAFAAQQFGSQPTPQPQRQPNAAAMNPEVDTPFGKMQGETSGGFSPAAYTIEAGNIANRISKGAMQLREAPANLARKLMGMPDTDISRAIDQEQADAKQPMKDLREVHPGSTSLAGVTMAAVSPNKLAPVTAAMEYGTPAERALQGGAAFLGNKVGEKVGQVFGRAVHPVRPGELSKTQTLANEAADRLGVKLSAGEATGNKTLKWAESTTADLPLAAGMATKRTTANQRAMNAAALRQLGEKGDEVTEDALAAARSRISGEYSRVLEPAKIELDSSFRAEVKSITGSKVMKELRDESTDKILDQFRNMPEGKIKVSGEWFQQNKTALDAQIRAAYNNGEPGKAMALEGFEKALDRAAMRSMSAEDRAAYKQAGRQWATLRTLETGKVVENGNVMPGRLDQAMTTRYKGAYKEGRLKGDLPDVARLAGTLRPPPNSGTLPRSYYAGGIGGAALFEPVTAGMMLGGPAAIQGLTTSPLMRSYMMGDRGLLNVTPEKEALLKLLGGKAGLLGAASMYD